MKSLICNGSKVSYQGFGNPENPSILFLHNGGSDHSIWSPIAERLVNTHYILSLDWPGFGQSETTPSDFSLQAYTQVLTEFIDQLQLKNITLVGHCLGSATALNYCRSVNGQGIKSLILFNVLTPKTLSHSANLFIQAKQRPLLNGVYKWLENKFPQSKIARSYVVNYQIKNGNKVSGKSKKHLSNLYIGPRNIHNLVSLAEALPSFKNLDSLEKTEEFPPTLVIWSKKNKVLPYKQGKSFIKHFKPDETVILNGGHLVMLEKEGECAGLIKGFVNQLPVIN